MRCYDIASEPPWRYLRSVGLIVECVIANHTAPGRNRYAAKEKKTVDTFLSVCQTLIAVETQWADKTETVRILKKGP